MALDNFLKKEYELTSSDHFDDYMKAIEVNGVLRKVASKLHPIITLTKSGKVYKLTSTLKFKEFIIEFEPGKEFDQETPDGRDVKSIITINGTTLHEVQKDKNGKVTVIDRIFTNDEVKMVLKIEDVVATRYYKINKHRF